MTAPELLIEYVDPIPEAPAVVITEYSYLKQEPFEYTKMNDGTPILFCNRVM